MDIYNEYVYAYIRSKDSKTAKAGTPYYIGRGKGRRAWTKHRNVSIPNNPQYIIIIENNLSNVGSCALERRYIRWYGKREEGGILHNRTDGGDGVYNFRHSDETKKLISIQNQERFANGYHPFNDEHIRKHAIIKLKKSANTRVANRTHNFQDRDWASKRTAARIDRGDHNFFTNHPTKQTVTCPHCNKSGPRPQMLQWHFDKCKSKT